MSYILDAIKKADQKRKLGEVPDVSTIHETPMVEPRRFSWLYGLAAILFVNAAGLAWWLWLKTPSQQDPVTHVPGSPAAVIDQQMPSLSTFQTTGMQALPGPPMATAPPTIQPPVTPMPPPSSQIQGGGPPVQAPSRAVEASTSSSQSSQNPTAFVPVQEEIPPPSFVAEQDLPDEVEVSEEELLAEEESLSAEEQVDEPVASSGQVLAPIAVSPEPIAKPRKTRREEDPELAKIPFLKQLPVEIQKTLPVLHISFHSYAIRPEDRLVSISGKILRQGQEFDENLKLERITLKGVVFNFNGKLFRLDV